MMENLERERNAIPTKVSLSIFQPGKAKKIVGSIRKELCIFYWPITFFVELRSYETSQNNLLTLRFLCLAWAVGGILVDSVIGRQEPMSSPSGRRIWGLALWLLQMTWLG